MPQSTETAFLSDIWLPFIKHCQTSIAEPVYMKK